jgi:hypothetical protein
VGWHRARRRSARWYWSVGGGEDLAINMSWGERGGRGEINDDDDDCRRGGAAHAKIGGKG